MQAMTTPYTAETVPGIRAVEDDFFCDACATDAHERHPELSSRPATRYELDAELTELYWEDAVRVRIECGGTCGEELWPPA